MGDANAMEYITAQSKKCISAVDALEIKTQAADASKQLADVEAEMKALVAEDNKADMQIPTSDDKADGSGADRDEKAAREKIIADQQKEAKNQGFRLQPQ